MPKPKLNESKEDFVSRCIPIVMKDGTAKDNKQATAICYSMYKEGKTMSKKFTFDLDAIKNMGGAEYAASEAWDCYNACQAMLMICQMCMNEVDEPDDMQSLANIMTSLMEFINGELKEMIAASKRGIQEEKQEYAMMGKKGQTITNNYYGSVTVSNDGKMSFDKPKVESILDLSYVKSLGSKILEKDLAVKYVSKNTIAHPVFIWGDSKKTDFEYEFFTRESDLWDEPLKSFERPLTWDHGQDELFAEFENDPVIGKTVKYYDDPIARWAESVITTDKQYRKWIDQWIEEKRLGYSSDSAPQYVVRVPQGKATWLKSWPWFGGSLTVKPCEPRMKTTYTPEFIKSLGILLPDMSTERETWTHEMAMLDFYQMKYIK